MEMKKRLVDDPKNLERRRVPDPTWSAFNPLLEDALGDIAGTRLLGKLYCPLRLRRYDEFWLPSMLFERPIAFFTPKQYDEGARPISLAESLTIIKKSTYINPILLLGRVGTGKTTYIHYFFDYYLLQCGVRDQFVPIYLDFIGGPLSNGDIHRWTLEQIDKGLKVERTDLGDPSIEMLKEILGPEMSDKRVPLDELAKIDPSAAERDTIQRILNLQDQLEVYNRARIRYLQSKGKRPILVFDNVDHHLEEKYHITVFEEAASQSQDLKCPLILALREYNYSPAYHHMALASLRPRHLHLTPTIIPKMLLKRVGYILDNASEQASLGAQDGYLILPSGIRMDKESVVNLLEHRLNGILNRRVSDDLWKLSNYNLRELISMVHDALSSGHLYPRSSEERPLASYFIDRHNFIRAMMLGNYPIYVPPEFDRKSRIINLFENESPYQESNNLVRYRCLEFVYRGGRRAYQPSIIDDLVSIGYVETEVLGVLRLLRELQLIEYCAPDGPGESATETVFLRVTPMGRFYFEDLFRRLTYAQEIKAATYLPSSYFETVNESWLAPPKGRIDRKYMIEQRIAETELFVDFISEMEAQERQKAPPGERSRNVLASLTSPSTLMRVMHKEEKSLFL